MAEKNQITYESTKEYIADFLCSSFKLKDNIKNNIIQEDISGDIFYELEENDLKLLGIPLGKVKKIMPIIDENKGKFNKFAEKEIKQKITFDSKSEEVKSFFENILDFKKDLKDLDGKGFLELKEEEMIKLGLNMGQRKKLIKYINFFKSIKNDKEKESELKISPESDEEEVSKYLKEKLNFSDKSIENLGLDGETLFSLKESDLEGYELTIEELENIKNFIKKINKQNEKGNDDLKENISKIKINKNSNNEEVKNFLENELKFSDNSMELLKDFDGDYLFSLKESEINDSELSDEEKKVLLKFLNEDENRIKNIEEKKEDNEQNNPSNTTIKSNYEPEPMKEKIKYPLKNFKVNPFIKDSDYNIFFNIYLESHFLDNLTLSIYIDKGRFFTSKFLNYKPYILDKNDFCNSDDKQCTHLLFQVPLNKCFKKLYISLTHIIYNVEYKSQLENKKQIKNYFLMDHLYFSKLEYYNKDKIIHLIFEEIIEDFLAFFLNKENNVNENLKIILINALIHKILKNNKPLEFDVHAILSFFKSCSKLKIEPKKIDLFEIKPITKKNRKPLIKSNCLSSDEINNLTNSVIEKKHLANLFVSIYANYDKECLMELIQSSNGKDYSRAILDLLIKKNLNAKDFSFTKKEYIIAFQNNLLSVSTNKEEINLLLEISENLTKCLEFIALNYKKIYSILDKASSFWYSNQTNYLLSLPDPTGEEDINSIYTFIVDIFKYSIDKDTNNKEIIDKEQLFNKLINFYSYKTLDELCQLQNFINFFKKHNIELYEIEKLYKLIHSRGMNYIMNNKFTIPQILNFIHKKDIYYYSDVYKNNILRDPKIFKFIPITDKDKDYLNNIKLLNENRIFRIFEISDKKKKNNFYEVI